jgi:AcrR family transcriptional regulator
MKSFSPQGGDPMHYGCAMSVTDGDPGAVPGRRAQLLAAAREELARSGYERTTVSSIATRAHVAQGTFYLYFRSKEALPGALAEELSAALGAAARDVTARAAELDSAVEDLVAATFAACEQYRDVLLIANRGIELAEDFSDWLGLTKAWREPLEDFLRALQALGQVQDDIDVRTTALVLRDLLDRSMKARLLFADDAYARATSMLVRRALATG